MDPKLEYYFSNAQSRYKEACDRIIACDNKIADLKNQRKSKEEQIRQLIAYVKSREAAQEEIILALTREETLHSILAKITSSTEAAATGYITMASSSADVPKDLTQVYADETELTSSSVYGVIEGLKTKSRELYYTIEESRAELDAAQIERAGIETSINTTETNRSEWKVAKDKALMDMDYYRNQMRKSFF